MLFNSRVFVIFFLVVYGLYLSLGGRRRIQNFLLLVASYVFYGYWDYRFLLLLIFSTMVDYHLARRIETATDPRRRKFFLSLSLVFNLSCLGFFKYFNFFADGFTRWLNLFGLHPNLVTLEIVLPVGISFYTFQEMSYVVDVYRGELPAEKNLLDFSLFICFFPQLVAGPIERARNLLSQISSPRTIQSEQVHAGIFLLLWGYFKKMVVADNLGLIANEIFDHYPLHHGFDILIGILAFAFQIYGDFSGYSDIGRGLAKLMGFELTVNFKLPYFALNPRDFWSRWHISLSTWLRDYLYIPLGGNRKGPRFTLRNLAWTMLLGGLWHGASWNFVLWGGYHGALLILHRWFFQDFPLPIFVRRVGTFALVTLGWIFFRSRSPEQIIYLLTHAGVGLSGESLHWGYNLLLFTGPLLCVEALQHRTEDLLILTKLKSWFRSLAYASLAVSLLVFGVRKSVEFIYFRF